MPNNPTLDKILTNGWYLKEEPSPVNGMISVITIKPEVKAQIAEAIEYIIGKDDRDYSHDNADTESLKLLIAMSSAVNEEKSNQRERLREFLESSNDQKS